jgi:peptidoglycan/LPS O-acetylase OafA/YrhL
MTLQNRDTGTDTGPAPLPTPESTAKSRTIKALAGARALPPLLIVLYHFCEGHHYSGLLWLDRFLARGYLWVEFFFVLSGFILTYRYGHRLGKLLTWRGYTDFLRARLTRLYPLHLFILLLILAMVVGLRALAHAGGYTSIFDLPYHQDVSTKGFILSLLLVHGWHTMDRLTWNGLSWFVSVEFALYLVFPAVLWLAMRGGWRRAMLLIVLGLGCILGLLITLRHGLDQTYDWGLVRGLGEFLVGAGMAVLFARLAQWQIPVWIHSGVQILLLAGLAASFAFTGWAHTFNDIYTVLPMMALVLALAFDEGVLADMLKTAPLQRLGEWSYAVYLGQSIWLLVIRHFANGVYPPDGTPMLGTTFGALRWGLEPALLVIVCVIWGWALTRWVERPATRFLRGRRSHLDLKSISTPS